MTKQYYTGCLSKSAVTKFKEKIPIGLNPVSCFNVSDDSHIYFNFSQTDHLVETAAGCLHMTLDSIAPLKKKLIKQRKQAPWCNSKTYKLKQTARKLERKWHSTNLKEFQLAWQDGFKTYRNELCKAKATYYSSLTEDNKNNLSFLFSTMARLTES